MIKTSTQIKALVRNKSGGNSTKAQIIIRNYIMERFLERLSLSSYKENIIVKGGLLISSIVGLDNRSTMDIDSTLINEDLELENIKNIVFEIINIELEDNIQFKIIDVSLIMDNLDYPGIRVSIEATLDKMKTPLKLDFSTGDKITPIEIEYEYPLMFEDRSISIMTYNLETVLAEKLETIISRGILNTRMRDFYDIFALLNTGELINEKHLNLAVHNTFINRGTTLSLKEWKLIIGEISYDVDIKSLWKSYQNKFEYANVIKWEEIVDSVNELINLLTM